MRGLASFLTPAAQQGEACKTEEREGGRLGNQVDLNREGVGASKVGVPEAIEGVAHSACLVKVATVGMICSSEGSISQDAVLDSDATGALDARRDEGSPSRDGECMVRAAEGNAILGSGIGVDGGPEGEHGVIGRAIHNGQEGKHTLSHACGARVGSSLIVPSSRLVSSRRQKDRIGDVDVLTHLVIGAVGLGILNADKTRTEADCGCARAPNEGDSEAGGEESFFGHGECVVC